jgi:hypothetical protein
LIHKRTSADSFASRNCAERAKLSHALIHFLWNVRRSCHAQVLRSGCSLLPARLATSINFLRFQADLVCSEHADMSSTDIVNSLISDDSVWLSLQVQKFQALIQQVEAFCDRDHA